MPSAQMGAMPVARSTENTRTSLTNPLHQGLPGPGCTQSPKGMARTPGFDAAGRYQLKAWWSQSASLEAEWVPTRACAVRVGWARSPTSKRESWTERRLQSGRAARGGGGGWGVGGRGGGGGGGG